MPRSIALLERIQSKYAEDENGCWIWNAARDRHGYGHIKVGGRLGRLLRAHRVAYELLVGPIPEGLQLDHLCRVRSCINPAHLEPVTSGENTRRSPWNSATHCRNGHARPIDSPAGRRRCLVCHRAACKRYRLRSLTPTP